MIKKQGFIFILTILILFIANQLFVGFLSGPPNLNPDNLTNKTQIKPQKLFERTWKEINSGFYDSTLNSQDWSYWKKHYKGKIKTDEDAKVAIDTMIASLNEPYTRFMPQKDYEELTTSITSKIYGIGVNIYSNAGKIEIFNVMQH